MSSGIANLQIWQQALHRPFLFDRLVSITYTHLALKMIRRKERL